MTFPFPNVQGGHASAAGYALDDGTSTETYPTIHMDAGSGVTKNGSDQVTEWASRINTFSQFPLGGDLVRAPTYSASSSNLNSKPVIVFDGGDQMNGGANTTSSVVAGRNALPSTVTPPYWVIMAVHIETAANNDMFWSGQGATWATSGNYIGAMQHTTLGHRFWDGNGTSRYTNGSPSTGGFSAGQYVLAWQADGDDSYLYDSLNRYPFNGTQNTTVLEEDFAIGGLYRQAAYALNTDCEVAEVFIYDDLSVTMDGNTLDGGDLKVVVDYLKTKYSI